jgi:hypothetical protein
VQECNGAAVLPARLLKAYGNELEAEIKMLESIAGTLQILTDREVHFNGMVRESQGKP